MTLVTDTSVVIPALVDGGLVGDTARGVLSTSEVIAPSLLDVEVISALRGRVRGGKLDPGRARDAIGELRGMPVDRCDMGPLLHRVWELRENVTAYDAVYVALAEVTGAALVTADRRLAHASGPRCRFRLLDRPRR